MPEQQRCKLLRLHFTEREQHRGKFLYDAVIQRCRELKIAGASAFRGLEAMATRPRFIAPISRCAISRLC
jgi:PII-like signaling protein